MDVKQVCKDVAWDGESFYCMRCGKVGFQSEAQARGHLSQCRGRAIEKGVFFAPEPVVVAPPAGGGGGGQNTTHMLGGSGGTSTYFSQEYVNHEQRIAQLENEYNHVLLQRNLPSSNLAGQDFFSQYKGIIIIGAILLFLVILSQQSRNCQALSNGNGSSGGKGVDITSIGTKALSKLVDTGITKGISSLFK